MPFSYYATIPILPELQKRFQEAPQITLVAVRDAVNKSLTNYQREAKLNAPVDTGRLRQGILVKPATITAGGSLTKVSGSVGTNVQYACIFNTATRITTKDGFKRVGDIKIGDLVLTQAGDYQPVIAKTAFPAREKPDMVDIEIEWRKGLTHKITVTKDHKILTFREGRNKWIEAGNLTMTDLLYTRIKKPYNKGTAKKVPCAHCGKQTGYKSKNINNYCSWECTVAHWQDGGSSHVGMRRTESTREKMRQIIIDRIAKQPELHINRILGKKGRKTAPEKAVEEWLESRNIRYLTQYKIGQHYVDFYLPDRDTILEADGGYWHRDQEKDITRDREISSIMQGTALIHLHFFDKRFSPPLDTNPSPNVHYVSCNPGPDSYADPLTFRQARIVSLKPWQYGTKKHRNDAVRAKLYDLSIANVHSFVANGIVVSNSAVELGTGIYGPNKAPILPKKKPYFTFKTKGGGWVRVKSIRGMRGRFYMRDALENNQATTNGYFDEAAETITRRLAEE